MNAPADWIAAACREVPPLATVAESSALLRTSPRNTLRVLKKHGVL